MQKKTPGIEFREQTDIEKIRKNISDMGFMPEHKFEYFIRLTDEGKPAAFFTKDIVFPCFLSNEGRKKVIHSLMEPLAKDTAQACSMVTEYFLENGFEKVVFETRFEVKKELIEKLKNTQYRVMKERYFLTWPVFIMQNFDENLAGGKWKKMRNFRHKFFRENKAEITGYSPKDKEALKELVMKWARERTAGDRAYYKRYLNFIESDFAGFDMVKIIRIGGKPVSMFGGWRIPNSDNYYSCLGIYDYDIENLGEVSNLLDLTFIKQMGYKKADFGGGEEALTNFKKKFHPDEFYRTDYYSVVKR